MAAAGEARRAPRRSRRRGSGGGRLSRSAEFDRVYREGRSLANRYLVIYAFPRPEPQSSPRLGVSVGRKVGGAVDRNRVKRLLREAFWATADGLPASHDYVLVARPDAGTLAKERGEAGVEAALRELVDEGGLVEETAG